MSHLWNATTTHICSTIFCRKIHTTPIFFQQWLSTCLLPKFVYSTFLLIYCRPNSLSTQFVVYPTLFLIKHMPKTQPQPAEPLMRLAASQDHPAVRLPLADAHEHVRILGGGRWLDQTRGWVVPGSSFFWVPRFFTVDICWLFWKWTDVFLTSQKMRIHTNYSCNLDCGIDERLGWMPKYNML